MSFVNVKYSFNEQNTRHVSKVHVSILCAWYYQHITFRAPTALSHALCINGVAWMYHRFMPLSTESPSGFVSSSHALGDEPKRRASFGKIPPTARLQGSVRSDGFWLSTAIRAPICTLYALCELYFAWYLYELIMSSSSCSPRFVLVGPHFSSSSITSSIIATA